MTLERNTFIESDQYSLSGIHADHAVRLDGPHAAKLGLYWTASGDPWHL